MVILLDVSGSVVMVALHRANGLTGVTAVVNRGLSGW
jgi:hypothetical protein